MTFDLAREGCGCACRPGPAESKRDSIGLAVIAQTRVLRGSLSQCWNWGRWSPCRYGRGVFAVVSEAVSSYKTRTTLVGCRFCSSVGVDTREDLTLQRAAFQRFGRFLDCIIHFLTWARLLSDAGTRCRSCPCPPSLQVIGGKHEN